MSGQEHKGERREDEVREKTGSQNIRGLISHIKDFSLSSGETEDH